MAKVEQLLSRLEKVKGRNGSWTACCPAHKDRSPSLSVRETSDGRVLLHCFAGCEVDAVLGAVGMDLTDLFPDRPDRPDGRPAAKPERQRFYASDLLRVIGFEAMVVMVAAHDISTGKSLSESDMQRLRVASQRINEAMEYANVNP
jgi:hypothetical protein